MNTSGWYSLWLQANSNYSVIRDPCLLFHNLWSYNDKGVPIVINSSEDEEELRWIRGQMVHILFVTEREAYLQRIKSKKMTKQDTLRKNSSVHIAKGWARP
jgi:hypothetical protein